jgi:hypothetical protein
MLAYTPLWCGADLQHTMALFGGIALRGWLWLVADIVGCRLQHETW